MTSEEEFLSKLDIDERHRYEILVKIKEYREEIAELESKIFAIMNPIK